MLGNHCPWFLLPLVLCHSYKPSASLAFTALSSVLTLWQMGLWRPGELSRHSGHQVQEVLPSFLALQEIMNLRKLSTMDALCDTRRAFARDVIRAEEWNGDGDSVPEHLQGI